MSDQGAAQPGEKTAHPKTDDFIPGPTFTPTAPARRSASRMDSQVNPRRERSRRYMTGQAGRDHRGHYIVVDREIAEIHGPQQRQGENARGRQADQPVGTAGQALPVAGQKRRLSDVTTVRMAK